jgi:NAD(P)-dependent dehydrogenase (short-subunit alcohol dehydrogenase family)
MRLESKVALITGGYGGMGRASARLFAREGATVFVAGRNHDRGDALVAEINGVGGKAHFVELDVVNQDHWDAAVVQIKEQAGALHVLMNIVGSNALVRFPEVDIEQWNKLFETNVTANVRGIQTCAPLIRDSGGGSIVNIGSVAGITGNFGTGYSSSKWALEGLSRSAAYIYADWGIRSNVIQPGWIETDLTAAMQSNPIVKKMQSSVMKNTVLLRPERQGGGDCLHGPVPGQRRVLLHHGDRHRCRWRMVLCGPLPHQRTIPSHARSAIRQGQGGACAR